MSDLKVGDRVRSKTSGGSGTLVSFDATYHVPVARVVFHGVRGDELRAVTDLELVTVSDTASREAEIASLRRDVSNRDAVIAAQDAELAVFRAAAATDDSWVTPEMRAHWDSIVAVPCEPEPANDLPGLVQEEIMAARIASVQHDPDHSRYWGRNESESELNRAGWLDSGLGLSTHIWRAAGWLAHQIYWHYGSES